ncbi:UNVERIFIED_CONTAM: hypothetical protein FKN15_019124 [Acipenser sinensis]
MGGASSSNHTPTTLAPPTTSNSCTPFSESISSESATSVAAWVLGVVSVICVFLTAAAVYYLRKRTCLFVQKKSSSGLFLIGSESRCGRGQAWSVALRHTRVVVCSHGNQGRGRVGGEGEEEEEENEEGEGSSFCEPRQSQRREKRERRLSGVTQSSLHSLISSL